MSARRSATLIALAMLVPLALPLIPTAYASAATGSFGSGDPTFAIYPGPSYMDSNGEPTMGIDQTSNAIIVTGSHFSNLAKHAKLTFDDSVNPALPTWTDVTPTPEDGMPATGWGVGNIDPILWTDHNTGRTWVGGLDGACSVLYITDNDGASYTPGGNSCVATLDHETIGTGPFHDPAPPSATGYPDAVYYCAQASVVTCAASYDGGLTYPITADVPCEFSNPGEHGHVQVMPDGTAWLPFDQGTSHLCIAHSEDNGQSWAGLVMPNATPSAGFDPSLAVTPHNWLYVAYPDTDGRTHVALTKDHGATFDYSGDLGAAFGLKTTTFHVMLAGDDDRAAVAFLGTTACCVGQAYSDHNWQATWYLYVSYTYDGGKTWTTTRASNDIVQRGCIWDGGGSDPCRNLLDFMGGDVDNKGRVVVVYPEGCLGSCQGPGGTNAQSESSLGTIARQTTGRGLYAAYDAAGVTITSSPSGVVGSAVSLVATASGVSPFHGTVSWGDSPTPETFSGLAGPTLTLTHTYATAASFPITLTVTDASGSTTSASTTADITSSGTGGGSGTIHISSPTSGATVGDAVHVVGTITSGAGNRAPTAAFTFNVNGLSVSVDGTSSSDPDGDALAYAWTFGDSSAGAGAATSHTFAGPGTYNVCLTVSDGSLTSNVCHAITIAATSGVDVITTDPAGDATDPILGAATTPPNNPSLDILKLEATKDVDGNPVFITTVADMSTDPIPQEGANGVFWMVEWTGPDGTTDYVSVVANTFLTVGPESTGTLECTYGTISNTGGQRTLNSEGAASCTQKLGANGNVMITYPGGGSHGYTATSTLTGVKGETGVVRGAPPNPAVTAQSSFNFDTTGANDYQLHSTGARFAKLGLLNLAAPLPAPTTVPANPQVTDHVDDTPFEAVPQINVTDAWFDSDANYLYVGMHVNDIPTDVRTTSYTFYEVDFTPTYAYDDASWGGHVGSGAVFTGLRTYAAIQPVALNITNTPPAAPGVDQASDVSFELQETDNDATTGQGHLGTIGKVTGSMDPNTDIIWWQIPRTLLQNPPGGGALTTTSAASGLTLAGTGTLNGIDSTGSGEDYTFPLVHVDPPTVTFTPSVTSGPSPLSVDFAVNVVAHTTLASWNVDLGDGTTDGGAGVPPTSFHHVYNAPGIYTATLHVLDAQGNSGTGSAVVTATSTTGTGTTIQVSAGGLAPITATCASSCADWSADLDLSSLATGPVTIHANLVTDGNVQSADSVSVTLQRATATGVTIDSPTAGASLLAGNVNVAGRLAGSTDQAPTASLTADTTQGVAPLAVTFHVDGTDDHGIVSWSLDTRDAQVATGGSVPATVTHTYPAGDFDPQLTVRDSAGHVATMSTHVHVSATNSAPTAPHDPTPADGATNVPLTTTLSWSSEDANGDTLSYTVHLVGSDGSDITVPGQTSSYAPPTLTAGTTYSWTVTASDGTASTTGPTWTFTTAAAVLGEAAKPHVVIGEIDTGMNPYNREFHRSWSTVNPQTYITGMANIQQINLCFFDNTTKTVDESRCPGNPASAPDADASEWAKVHATPTTSTGANQGNIYWFAGTNLLLVSYGGGAGFNGLDGAKNAGSSHGTATSSNAVGSRTGTCPECFDVLVQASLNNQLGPGYTWLSNQPWIDVITSSTSCGPEGDNPAGQNPICGQPTDPATKNAVSQGKLVFESSGNGIADLGAVPTTTAVYDNFNPWTIAVGCSATGTGNDDMCLYSDTPNPIEASGINREVASVDSYTGTGLEAGTSFSSPAAAGVTARTIYELRTFYGDTQEGASTTADHSIVRIGSHAAPTRGPLANGILTRLELEEVLFKTARRDFLPTESSSLAGTSGQSAFVAGTPASFVKEGYGQVYSGNWGVNGPGADPSWASTGDMVSVILGNKDLPQRPVEQFWWDSVIQPAQEKVFGNELPDTDSDAYPRTDAMDPNNLGGYHPSAVTEVKTPKDLGLKAAIQDGVQPTDSLNRLYIHAADLGSDPNQAGNELFDYYMNTVASPEDPSCTGAGCADSNAGAVGAGGFHSTYTIAHPSLTGVVGLDMTKDVDVHIVGNGFAGPTTTTTLTATILNGDGSLVGTGSATAVPSADPQNFFPTIFDIKFKPLVGSISGPVTLEIASTDTVYQFFVNGFGNSYMDLPITGDLGQTQPAAGITYYVDDFATKFSSNGNTMTITRDTTKIAPDADRNGVVFNFPQTQGIVMPLQSDDVLSTAPAFLAGTGKATVYVCSPVDPSVGAEQATVDVTLAAGDIILGSGSMTQLLVGQHNGDTTPFEVPLSLHESLVPLNTPLTGTIHIAGPGGVFPHNMALCGGGAAHPWKIELGLTPLDVPTATLAGTAATLTGSVTLSGVYNAPARPDLQNLEWYAKDLGQWTKATQSFTLDTGGAGTASPGDAFPPQPAGLQLTFTSARPVAADAPALSSSGVGVAQFWVDSVGPAPQVTVDMAVFLQGSSGARMLGQGSVTKSMVGSIGTVVPRQAFEIDFKPLVTDPRPDEHLVFTVVVHDLGPASGPQVTCVCGDSSEPVFVSLPKAIDTTPTAKAVDITLGAVAKTVSVTGSTWSTTVDTRQVANGAQTIRVTPHASYAGSTIDGLAVTRSVNVQNILDTPPTASLSLSTLTGFAPLGLTATMTGSDAQDSAALLTWKIHWGDGSSDQSGTGLLSPVSRTHTYAASGTYTATLTVTDSAGQIATSSQTVTVMDQPPVDQILISLDGGSPVVATDDSTDGSFSAWHHVFDIETVGVHTVDVQHTQGSSTLDEKSVTFSIYKNTHIAIATPAGGSAVDAGSSLTGTADSSDPILSVDAATTPDFASPVSATSSDGFANWAVNVDALGLQEDQPTLVYVRAVTVNGSAMDQTSITLNAAPNPRIDVLDPLPAYSQRDLQFHGSATPAASNAPIASWAWSFGDGATSTEIDPIHAYDHSGSYTVTLAVVDANGKTDSTTSTVMILDQAPIVTLASDPVSPTDLEDATITATATDNDGTIVGVPTVTVYNGGDSSAPILASGSSPLTLRFPDNGVYFVSATATDNENVQGTGSASVSVLNVRPVAALTASASLVAVGQPVTLDASGSSDPDGNVAGYEFDFGDGQVVDITSPTIDHAYAASGTYHVTVTVTDNDGSSITSSPVDVIANAAPVFQGLTNQIVAEGATLSFTVSATDQENDPLTYSAGTLPAGATFDTPTATFSWTTDFGSAGNYPVTFSVTDGHSVTSKTITISVGDVDRPPVLDAIGAKSGAEASPLTFTLTGSDPDVTDVLHYTMTGAPSGATLGSLTGVFAWTPTYTQAGVYHVTFTIDDGNLSASEIVTITIANTDRAPVLNAIAPKSVLQLTTLSIPLTASDPDSDPLNFAIGTPLDGLTVANDGNGHGRLLWTPTLAELGPYTVSVIVTDGQLSATRTVVLTAIFNTDESLIHASSSAVSVSPGETTMLTATLKNIGVQRDTFSVSATNTQGWALGQLPAPITLDPGQSATITLNVTADGSKPVSYTTISTTSMGDGTTVRSVRFRVDVPVVVTLSAMGHLTNEADIPKGTVHVTHLDGTPAVHAAVKADQMPPQIGGAFETSQSGFTDANGDFHFDFSNDAKALTPGKHQFVITANKVGGFTTTLVTRYDIGPAVN